MGAKTGISWTDSTWNPIRGCSMAKGSETGGCLNCYAARLNARGLPALNSPTTGLPFARIMDSGPRWTGAVELIEKQLHIPRSWKKPRRIFVNSMSDLFHESLSEESIDRVFAVMALCPQHQFQVLTKRPERMCSWSEDDCRDKINCTLGYPEFSAKGVGVWLCSYPLPNVWLGVSVENQATANSRIPLLTKTPAAIRFVSYEPALASVDFYRLIHGINWLIIGGESGPGARPFDLEWADTTIQQCRDAGVACFVKQLGSRPVCGGRPFPLKDSKGGDWDEWPEWLRVREMPDGATKEAK